MDTKAVQQLFLNLIETEHGPAVHLQIADWKLLYPAPTVYHNLLKEYEAAERAAALSTFDENDTVIEIGAGIGAVTVALGTIAKYVHAYEPQAEMAFWAQANVELNGLENVTVYEAGIAVSSGKMKLHIRADPVLSSAIEYDPRLIDSSFIVETREVRVFSLEETIEAHDADAIHMDTEGAEHFLLLNTPLEKIRKIVYEAHPQILGMDKMEELRTHLRASGFTRTGRTASQNFPTQAYTDMFLRE